MIGSLPGVTEKAPAAGIAAMNMAVFMIGKAINSMRGARLGVVLLLILLSACSHYSPTEATEDFFHLHSRKER